MICGGGFVFSCFIMRRRENFLGRNDNYCFLRVPCLVCVFGYFVSTNFRCFSLLVVLVVSCLCCGFCFSCLFCVRVMFAVRMFGCSAYFVALIDWFKFKFALAFVLLLVICLRA